MPGQVDQLPELLAVAYPIFKFRNDIETAPILIAELVETGTVRQQLSGAVQDAPPHRFRELFLTGAVSPKPRVVLDGPEPVSKCEVVRINIGAEIAVTRQ